MDELTLEHLRRRKDDARQAFDDAKAAIYYLAAVLESDEPVGRLRDLIEQANAARKRWQDASDAYIAFLEAEYIAFLEAEQAKSMVEAVQ